jgi:RHS repeat-associated protein
VSTSYTYDTLSRLLNVLHNGGSLPGSAGYTYDAAGNRTSKTAVQQASPNPVSVTSNFSYDAIYELTQAVVGGTLAEGYSYDAVGNRLTSGGPTSYNYNTSNELTSTSAATYAYDANGNTLSKTDSTGTTYYTWDYENRLASVTLPGTGGTVNLKYDPFGKRVEKIGPTGTTVYAYDGDNVIEELGGGGSLLAHYTHGDGIDEPLALMGTGGTYFYHADGSGSITSLTDSSGQIAASYVYDSFGKLTASTGSTTNPFRYTAREFDSETGLYYYRARYFDPSAGRFVSEDPRRFGSGVDFYVYVHNNAVNWGDPFGLDELTDDPAVRRCMCELWKASNWGWNINERTAWVILNKEKIRRCLRWPSDNGYSADSWRGPIPSQLDGLVHTHPTHQGRDPKPSTGCKDCDDQAAKKINRPVYTITDVGVWKITPQGKITQEAGPELLGGFDLKTCECKKVPKK